MSQRIEVCFFQGTLKKMKSRKIQILSFFLFLCKKNSLLESICRSQDYTERQFHIVQTNKKSFNCKIQKKCIQLKKGFVHIWSHFMYYGLITMAKIYYIYTYIYIHIYVYLQRTVRVARRGVARGMCERCLTTLKRPIPFTYSTSMAATNFVFPLQFKFFAIENKLLQLTHSNIASNNHSQAMHTVYEACHILESILLWGNLSDIQHDQKNLVNFYMFAQKVLGDFLQVCSKCWFVLALYNEIHVIKE